MSSLPSFASLAAIVIEYRLDGLFNITSLVDSRRVALLLLKHTLHHQTDDHITHRTIYVDKSYLVRKPAVPY